MVADMEDRKVGMEEGNIQELGRIDHMFLQDNIVE